MEESQADDESAAGGLRRRILDLIGRGAGATVPDSEFDRLALAVFRHQYARNPLYRAYCERRDASPETVGDWRAIPAVPTDAFKAAPLVSGDPASAAVVFRTSGTTAGADRRGAHHLLDTDLYRASLLAGFRAHLLPDRATMRVLSLVPSPAELPDSSLSFMIGTVVDELGADGSEYFVSGPELRVDAFVDAAEAAIASATPVLIAGTSFAFVHLLDALRERGVALRLPAGSRAMDTGGFKGRSREVARETLYATIAERLGIEPASIVNEYGMTEMSSQLYDGVAGTAGGAGGRVHRGPGWLRSVAVDPETLEPLPADEVGVLRHVDLANLYSVAALQTADLGRVRANGAVELLGRAVGAEARGCSIALDDLLEVMGRGVNS